MNHPSLHLEWPLTPGA